MKGCRMDIVKRVYRDSAGVRGCYQHKTVKEYKMKTQNIKVKIDTPQVKQITAKSNPKIWALLQPPKPTKSYNAIKSDN